MMNPKPKSERSEFYDAELSAIDVDASTLQFTTTAGVRRRVRTSAPTWWKAGTFGRLRLSMNDSSFSFFPYPDQRLRRDVAEDDSLRSLWGWKIEDQSFACKAGVIPGHNGIVVSEDTDTLVLEIPREFAHLCVRYKLRPDTVLRGFIADLCELMNWTHCPREDGYSSNGSDERQMAQQYFRRAYEWLLEPVD
jgi:hypothetical protein